MLPSVPGFKAPKLPKGESSCKYSGWKGTGKHVVYLTTDVTVLTGSARATFDTTWNQYRGTLLVTGVSGIGDDAAWLGAQLTLAGIKGPVAFVITLEPLPLTAFPPAKALELASAIARTVVAHL